MNIGALIEDAYEFISRLEIVGKDGKKVTLTPTLEQIEILDSLVSGSDTLVLKPRQIGSSTIVAAYLFWRMYVAKEPVTIAIISYKLKSSKHLLGMVKEMYRNLPAPLKREMGVENSVELSFADTGARIIAESAGAEGGIRSFTCTYAWISEFAFSPNPSELLAAAVSALNDGQLVIESTANYFNDAMHQEVMKSQNGVASWNFLFFPWTKHKEYSTQVEEKWELDEDEHLLLANGLTMEQLAWRREKMSKLGWEKFSREYPLTIDEAYQQLGDSYFKKQDLQYLDMLVVSPDEQVVFAKHKHDDRYAIGVDVSAGVGRDFSVVYVLSKMSGQPCYVYRSNTITPVLLAKKVQEVSKLYGNAKVLVESNNMGAVVLNELRHLGFSKLWKDEHDKDWLTTLKSKTYMFENLKRVISQGTLRQLDNITVAELRALTVNQKGHVVLPENMASHGDNVVALCLAQVCLDSIKLAERAWLPDWIASRKAKNTRQNGGVAAGKSRRY